MRKPLVAGNWKMNFNLADAVALAQGIAAQSASISKAELAICPASVHLKSVRDVIGNTNIGLGAQNVYFESNGAFTGELSVSMLADLHCKYVILGHSERRHILGETDSIINRKVKAVLAGGLIPIVCVGETLAEREAGQTNAVVQAQFDGSLAGITPEQMAKSVIAYEPVWAIGTGKVATPQQAQEVHAELRRLLTERYSLQVAEAVRIQYGGSVKPDNASELLHQADIDGALVGGASMKADSFLAIAAAA